LEFLNLSAVVGCYLAIIGMYVWVFRSISELRKEMQQHMSLSDQHASVRDLMSRGECSQTVKRIEEAAKMGKESFADFKKYIGEEFKEMKEMIKEQR
jgi:hypothetical protein